MQIFIEANIIKGKKIKTCHDRPQDNHLPKTTTSELSQEW